MSCFKRSEDIGDEDENENERIRIRYNGGRLLDLNKMGDMGRETNVIQENSKLLFQYVYVSLRKVSRLIIL